VDILRPVRAFDRFQQRRKWLAIPMAVVKKFTDDQAGSLAALLAYYVFFSLFPILLVVTTVLGFVVQGDQNTLNSVDHAITSHVPVVGQYIKVSSLSGSVLAVIVGLITSLLAGFGITSAAQNAFDRVWAVPFKERPDFLHARLRGLMLFVTLGVLFIASTALSGFVAGGLGGVAGWIGGVVIALAVNVLLFLAAFRFLTASAVNTSCLWIGVFVAAAFWEILQVGGAYYFKHVLKHSSHYGIFSTVIAILVILHLGAQLTLYAAEINVVLVRKLWPRSLLGPPAVPADEAALTALAKVEERHDSERVEVQFDSPPVRRADPGARGA
jgi:YihY family inner membrane protein